MGYESDMDEYYADKQLKEENKPYLKLHDNNLVNSKNIRLSTILWEYLCWKFAGKPDNYKYRGR